MESPGTLERLTLDFVANEIAAKTKIRREKESLIPFTYNGPPAHRVRYVQTCNQRLPTHPGPGHQANQTSVFGHFLPSSLADKLLTTLSDNNNLTDDTLRLFTS